MLIGNQDLENVNGITENDQEKAEALNALLLLFFFFCLFVQRTPVNDANSTLQHWATYLWCLPLFGFN